MSTKLCEIIDFFQQYSAIERAQIKFVRKEDAETRDRKKVLLKRQEEVFASMRQNNNSDDEFNTPDGSFEDGEQGGSPALQSLF